MEEKIWTSLHIAITSEIKDKLKEIANQDRVTVSELVRKWIEDLLEYREL
jgi:predicted transcriptional regulator